MTAVATKPMSKTAYIKYATNVLKQQFASDSHKHVLFRAVKAIHANQTSDEQASLTTTHDNGMGWTGRDAEFMSKMAENLIAWERHETTYVAPYSPKQLFYVRRNMGKYAGQLARMAWDKRQPA